MAEILIRGGLIVDGSGDPPFVGDIAIAAGKILAVGGDLSEHCVRGETREVDAAGRVVAPAWVDVHTHLDAQIQWDPFVTPLACNGVGTIAFGNCGCGFAPCAKEDRSFLCELMEGVEDIPTAALEEATPLLAPPVPWTP
jgi:N-acyl-D-aspartate/D-glutamate deacylase